MSSVDIQALSLARRRAWSAVQGRFGLALVGALLVATVAAGTIGGVLLRHAANVQRQTLRLQELGAESLRAANAPPRDERATAAALVAGYRSVGVHDPAEAARLRVAYVAFLRNRSTLALSRLESRIDAEVERLAAAARSTYPVARSALISAAVGSLLLIAILIWQFDMQRRAGRIARRNAERAAELARLRDRFVAVVSHELRTPLTSILGFIDLIEDDERGTLSDDQRAHFAVVSRNAHRLLRLVSDLLLIAEADDGMRLEPQDVDLSVLAHESVEAARVAADRKDIELTVSASPLPMYGDPLRLAQLLDNLISNAIKFTPEGGRVSVTTEPRNGHAALEVSDSGIGIAATDREQIFERFFRVQTSNKGAGLGLTITKAIVDAHRGSISVESEMGAGTTFRIELPRVSAQAT